MVQLTETLQTLFPLIPIETEQVGKGEFEGAAAKWEFTFHHIGHYLLYNLLFLFVFPPCPAKLVTSIYTKGSGGSQPAEPGISVKQSIACKPDIYTVSMYGIDSVWQKL